MSKWAADGMFDAGLAYIQACDKLVVCSQQPTTYTEANSTYMLASVAMTPTTDFPITDGDLSGRMITVAAKSATVTNSGTATHVALLNTSDTTLRLVTLCNEQILSSGGLIALPSFKYWIADPI